MKNKSEKDSGKGPSFFLKNFFIEKSPLHGILICGLCYKNNKGLSDTIRTGF
jgi:hypothetical protein